MLSKKYRGKICVYCARAVADTADHVVCRNFFENQLRRDLPKAPACKRCNDVKARLEHYLTAVLPFASEHPAALQGQHESLKRRLMRNASLQRRLQAGIGRVRVQRGDGSVEEHLALPFDGKVYLQYLEMVGRGLVWREWDEAVPAEYLVRAYTMTARKFAAFEEQILGLGNETRVQREYPEGALVYTGACAVEDRSFSTWKIDLYGNVFLATNDLAGGYHEIATAVVTGPPDLSETMARMQDYCGTT